jgi:hypothetical protein
MYDPFQTDLSQRPPVDVKAAESKAGEESKDSNVKKAAQRSTSAGRSLRPTTGLPFRNWETSMRKREVQQQSAPPQDLRRDYRFWESKLRRGELDSLFLKFKKRCVSSAEKENPPPSPGSRPSLREGLEKCERSDEDILQGVFSTYFEGVDEECLMLEAKEAGRTLMVHDLMNKWTIEDILGMLDDLGAENVDYVFLPLSVWETKKSKLRESRRTRNKAYCFVHFSDKASAQAFVERLNRYELPRETRSDGAEIRQKQMSASIAASAGVVPNLLRLMDIHNHKWHPRAGALTLRLKDGVVPVNVPCLRKLLLAMLKEDPKKAPGCLRKQVVQKDDKPFGH